MERGGRSTVVRLGFSWLWFLLGRGVKELAGLPNILAEAAEDGEEPQGHVGQGQGIDNILPGTWAEKVCPTSALEAPAYIIHWPQAHLYVS